MIRALAIWMLLALPVAAEPPRLASYVTDAGEDSFAAIYAGQAVHLAGCTTAAQARALLALPANTAHDPLTQDALQQDFALGTAPRIPCNDADFALDWPAATGIWADPADTQMYYLPDPRGGYVGVPSGCTALRAALAIRARLQLPGVLLGTGAPPDLGDGPGLVLDCGGGTETPTAPVAQSGAWSLHRFDTFLTEDSGGDTIPVLRHRPPGGGAPAYLPVLRVDGIDTRDALLAGDDSAARLEDALAALIGIDPEAPVTPLGNDAVAALRMALYADLCLTACAGYDHRHAIFAAPASDLGVTEIAPPVTRAGMDRLGAFFLQMGFADARALRVTGCDRLALALGMAAKADPDWQAAAGAALDDIAAGVTHLDCRASGPDLCLRRVADGGTLTPAMLLPGADCPAASRLRIELPATLTLPSALHLSGGAFAAVELAPAPGIARSIVTVAPSRPVAVLGNCVLAPADALIVAAGVPRLVLTAIDLRRAPGTDPAREALGIQIQSGALALSDSTVGGPEQPLQRGLNLCLADLYVAGGDVTAEAMAVQALASRLLMSGRVDAPVTLTAGRFGVLMMPGSTARLSHAAIAAATPAVLRGADLRGASVTLGAPAGISAGSGMLLERGATADLTISRVGGFRCAVSFADAASSLRLMLPGNDITTDNTHAACGPGRLELLE